MSAVVDQKPEEQEHGRGTIDDEGTCPCSSRWPDLTPEHHDFLTTWEERGLPGLVDIWTYMEADSDSQRIPGTLGWQDFEEFVARHSWQHPSDVYDLANLGCHGIRYRHEALKLRKLVDAG